jgi:hypothetical protein
MINLNNIEKLQLFCLESYKTSKNIIGIRALGDFEDKDVFGFLAVGYDVLHTLGIGYILAEINDYLENRK